MLLKISADWTVHHDAFSVELCYFVRLVELKLMKAGCDYRDEKAVTHSLVEAIYPQMIKTVGYLLDRTGLSDLTEER